MADAPCMRCGGSHPITACDLVTAIEFHESGDLKRVEFLTAADFAAQPSEPDDAERAPPYQTIQPGWRAHERRPKEDGAPGAAGLEGQP